jgi:hypothetical protein
MGSSELGNGRGLMYLMRQRTEGTSTCSQQWETVQRYD